MSAIMEDVSFGYGSTVEEIKPVLFGFIIPLVVVFATTSLFAGVAFAIFAAAMQKGVQGNTAKAKDTLIFGAIIPAVAIGFYTLGAIAVYAPKIAAAIAAFQAA